MKAKSNTCQLPLSDNAQSVNDLRDMERRRYLTTPEAADYLRKSQSWLLRQGDLPYLAGRPNTYAVADLDAWVERHKRQPLS
jgi:helix-turn-helix protein